MNVIPGELCHVLPSLVLGRFPRCGDRTRIRCEPPGRLERHSGRTACQPPDRLRDQRKQRGRLPRHVAEEADGFAEQPLAEALFLVPQFRRECFAEIVGLENLANLELRSAGIARKS